MLEIMIVKIQVKIGQGRKREGAEKAEIRNRGQSINEHTSREWKGRQRMHGITWVLNDTRKLRSRKQI